MARGPGGASHFIAASWCAGGRWARTNSCHLPEWPIHFLWVSLCSCEFPLQVLLSQWCNAGPQTPPGRQATTVGFVSPPLTSHLAVTSAPSLPQCALGQYQHISGDLAVLLGATLMVSCPSLGYDVSRHRGLARSTCMWLGTSKENWKVL